MYIPSSLWTWSFISVACVQAVIGLGFEAYVFATFQTHLEKGASHQSAAKAIPTFLSLYIFGFIYELLLVYDALRLKNTIQVIGLCLFNLALLIYAAVQMQQIQDAIDSLLSHNEIRSQAWPDMKPFLIAIPCVIAVGTMLMSFIAWKLYDEFAWTIYKHISADLRMKRRYLTFQIYIALLKFDFFFFLGFVVQFIVIVVKRSDPEFWTTIAAIPIIILILIMAGIFTRRESTIGMLATITLYFCALAYFIFKFFRMYQKSHEQQYQAARKPMTAFAVITIILILMTITNAIMCTMNFGKGLKPHIAARKVESDEEKAHMTEMPNLNHGPVPSRMTID